MHIDPPHVVALAQKIRAFVDEHVVPLEKLPHDELEGAIGLARDRARENGLYGPQIARRYGGLEMPLVELPAVFEAAGRSLLGPVVLHCSAPDEGNLHTLELAANDAQREKYLRPLATGAVRSAFAMTEPAPGAGSDPSAIKTTAQRVEGGWRIDGRKWFITGADGAAFYLVMARSRPDGPVHTGCTIFIVPSDTPGVELVRRVPVIGEMSLGGHCELVFESCVVGDDAILGEEGGGFALAQKRLGPARLTHCMRWTGAAQRSLEIAIERAKGREAFGSTLADKQSVQWMLADSHIELELGRLMIRRAAHKLDAGQDARLDCAMAKVHVAESVNRVIDRAIQICGAAGLSGDLPLGLLYAESRAFRIYDGASEVHRMTIARDLLRGRA